MVRIPGVDDAVLAAVGVVLRGAAAAASDAAAAVVTTARTAGEVLEQARETVQAVHRLALRADALVADLEGPLRDLAPGLTRLAQVLDDPVVDELPATLRQVQSDVLPVLRTLAETHERVAVIAGSTERIMAFVDDTGRTLSGLPGAGLLGRRWPVPRTVVLPGETAAPTDDSKDVG